MGKVSSQTLPVLSISEEERDRMYQLMEADYLGMDQCTFEKDLREKDCVMILRDVESGRIVGFSTLMVIDLPVQGTIVRAVFSGDSIVQSEFRRTLGLAVELGTYLRRVAESHPSDLVVWLLTSKGCRTYGILPLLFRDFYPRWDAPTPPLYTQMMDAFGAYKYPGEYDPVGHRVRHRGSAQRLRPGVADVTDQRLRDPHVQFFTKANPGHMKGDDLVCVADAREDNWHPHFRRILGG
ncbi:MAG TPA: hypothetical protein VMU36_11250 [Spirochaetia bacterium]|nr:hypothetical protein [Spirochaetia bacterium]